MLNATKVMYNEVDSNESEVLSYIMRILELLDGIDLIDDELYKETADMEIEELVYDSRKAGIQKVFVALTGLDVDGHDFVMNAYEKGARVFVVEKNVDLPDDAVVFVVKNSRKALSRMSANFYSHPSKNMTIIGVTGTKGKTTVSHYIRDILESNGNSCGLIGTVGVFYGNVMEDTANTTPESYELQRILRDIYNQGIDTVVMEVSSGGLMMHRVDDIHFKYGVFLNLTPDHIGEKEHPNFEHYRDSKAKLFQMAEISIINNDDEYADFMKSVTVGELKTFSLKTEGFYRGLNACEGNTLETMGTQFDFVHGKLSMPMFLPQPGLYNLYNALAAISVAVEMGVALGNVKKALLKVKASGRFQIMNNLDGVIGILDYAHNRVALLNLLRTVRSYNPQKIILVVGSVGNRTKERRRELAEVAAEYCDITILTEDNQDREDPLQITKEMAEYMKDGASEVYIEVDRRKAVLLALTLAQRGDAIVLAGKGHETYNLVCGKKVPYSDEKTYIEMVEVVRRNRES